MDCDFWQSNNSQTNLLNGILSRACFMSGVKFFFILLRYVGGDNPLPASSIIFFYLAHLIFEEKNMLLITCQENKTVHILPSRFIGQFLQDSYTHGSKVIGH